jgi:hypothetical protein
MAYRTFLVSLLTALVFAPAAPAQTEFWPNEGLIISPGSEDFAYQMTWWGKAGRTYFIQRSGDLVNWVFLYDIVSGTGAVIDPPFRYISTEERAFFRLRFSDIPTPDPWNADFDGDHVSNSDELFQNTDPGLYADSDGDGMSDDWEIRYGLDPHNPDDADDDPDLDGISNRDEYDAYTNPLNYFNGVVPRFTVIGSGEQTAEPGDFSPQPFVVEVTTRQGVPPTYVPMSNVPVRFQMTGQPFAGQVSATGDGNGLGLDVLLRTDSNGRVTIYHQHPATPPGGLAFPLTRSITMLSYPTNRGTLTVHTRHRYTYPAGTLGREMSDVVESRVAGKDPATALPIFSTQDHGASVYVRNTQCWAYDLRQAMTGISPWNSFGENTRAGTAITPQHLITSRHFPLRFNDTIRFITADNAVVTGTIVGVTIHPTNDIAVYTLAAPLPATITPCKLLPADYTIYLSELEKYRPPMIKLDQEEKALLADWAGLVRPPTILCRSELPAFGARIPFFEINEKGDSSNPVLFIVNHTPVLLSTDPGDLTFLTPEIATLNQMIADADADADARAVAEGRPPPGPTGFTVQTVDLSGFVPFTPP